MAVRVLAVQSLVRMCREWLRDRTCRQGGDDEGRGLAADGRGSCAARGVSGRRSGAVEVARRSHADPGVPHLAGLHAVRKLGPDRPAVQGRAGPPRKDAGVHAAGAGRGLGRSRRRARGGKTAQDPPVGGASRQAGDHADQRPGGLYRSDRRAGQPPGMGGLGLVGRHDPMAGRLGRDSGRSGRVRDLGGAQQGDAGCALCDRDRQRDRMGRLGHRLGLCQPDGLQLCAGSPPCVCRRWQDGPDRALHRVAETEGCEVQRQEHPARRAAVAGRGLSA